MATVTSYTKTGMDDLIAPIRYMGFNRKTSHYTLVLTDGHKCIEMDAAGANNLTVPPNSDEAFPIGTVVDVIQRGAGTTTIVPGDTVTLRSLSGYLTSAGQYARIHLHKVAANEWYVSGDLVA